MEMQEIIDNYLHIIHQMQETVATEWSELNYDFIVTTARHYIKADVTILNEKNIIISHFQCYLWDVLSKESNDKAIVDLCAFIGKNTMVSAAEFEIINN